MGDVHRKLAEYDQARECYEEALNSFKQIKARYDYADALAYLGLTFKGLNQNYNARKYLENSISLFEEIKSPRVNKMKVWLVELSSDSAVSDEK